MHLTLATAVAAAAQETPLIDLDSTVFIQWLLFLVTAIILSRLLFRPFLQVRADREKGIDGARDEARRLDEEARAQLTDYEARLAKARAAADAERAKQRAEALEHERSLTDKARTEAHLTLENARRSLESDAATARKALDARAQELGRSIAHKVLGREVP